MNVPRLFHEFYGEKTTKKALYGSLMVGFIATLLIGVIFWSSLEALAVWKIVLILLFTFDIFAGLIANFSEGTNQYYQERVRLSRIFIVIHVQPILLTLLAGESWLTGLYVYAFMLAAATLTLAIKRRNRQEFFGFFLTLIAVVFTLTYFQPLPTFLEIIFVAFNFKLIYGFSVNHYPQQA